MTQTATTRATSVGSPVESTRRRDKRRAILDAAAPVFGELGYERASVDAIAASARVSKPTIYSYFGNKEQLFRESVADSANRLNEDAREAVRTLVISEKSWRRSLDQMGCALTACHRSECAVALNRLVNAEMARDPEVALAVRRAGYEPIVEALAGRLAMLSNKGLLKIEEPLTAARQFIALTQAEIADLTELGTVTVSDAAVRRAVAAGVEVFVRAYAVS